MEKNKKNIVQHPEKYKELQRKIPDMKGRKS